MKVSANSAVTVKPRQINNLNGCHSEPRKGRGISLFRKFVILTWIVSHIAKFFLNSHELVVLADTVGT